MMRVGEIAPIRHNYLVGTVIAVNIANEWVIL